ncbi:MAG: hypothetical protein ACKO0Z_23075 [Betaproteobacteria bacterium]
MEKIEFGESGVPVSLVNGSGAIGQAVPDYETPAAMLAAYGNFSEVNWAGGDFISSVATSNGQAITCLSASPLSPGESRIVVNSPVRQPCVLEFEGSIVRNRQQYVSSGLYADGPKGPDIVPTPINIVSISQSSATLGAAYTGTAGTVVTIVLYTALPEAGQPGAVFLSDWINITGLVDSRLNYQNCAISFISSDRKVINFSVSDEAALPSLAIPVVTPTLGTAKVSFYNNAAGAAHGAGYRFTGTTDTSAVYWSIFGGEDAMVSGTLLGDHRASISSSAASHLNQVHGQFELKATSRYRIECYPEATNFLDRAVDVTATHWAHRVNRTAVKPGSEALLRPRFRLYQPPGMSRPIAKIVSISKSGTTTATINVAAAPSEPFAVGNVISVYGVRDQTNFANANVTITAVMTPTQIQCVLGSAVTATGYGGMVSSVNGGATQPGVIAQVGSTVKSGWASGAVATANPEWLDIACNATVSGLSSAGMYVDLYGWRDSAGNDLGVDGVWETAHVTGAQVVLKPVFDIRGVRQSPPTPSIPSATNCGGAIIVRTTARIHDMMLSEIAQQSEVRLAGQGTSRADFSLPVNLTSSPTVVQGSAASISSTSGLGGWYIHPAVTAIADVASAAITSTATSSAIANNLGNGFQITFPVTAVSGTSPTLDIRIEESLDGGTSWVTLYEMQRITAFGNYNTPILRATGRHIRYVRTITGTSPSFTMSITRNILPFIVSGVQKRIVDRSIVLTTLNSVTPVLFDGTLNNVQLAINIGAATTPPALQLEGSEDNTNWYPIGAPLTAVASSTVEVTVNNKSATFIRARVSTAGATVTAGYVSIKAWS